MQQSKKENWDNCTLSIKAPYSPSVKYMSYYISWNEIPEWRRLSFIDQTFTWKQVPVTIMRVLTNTPDVIDHTQNNLNTQVWTFWNEGVCGIRTTLHVASKCFHYYSKKKIPIIYFLQCYKCRIYIDHSNVYFNASGD